MITGDLQVNGSMRSNGDITFSGAAAVCMELYSISLSHYIAGQLLVQGLSNITSGLVVSGKPGLIVHADAIVRMLRLLSLICY